MAKSVKHLYEFGPFRLDTAEHLLLRGGEPVPLTPKAFDILLTLVENSGHLVHRDVLMKQVWPDTVVEENNLTQSISALRKALGEAADQHQYIETVPRRGYRFVADVKELADESVLIVGTHSRSRIVIEEEETNSDDRVGIDQVAEQEPHKVAGEKQVISRGQGLVFVAVCFVVGLLIVAYVLRQKAPAAGFGIRSIAVLPFKPLSPEGGDEYSGVGMADALITKLSNVDDLAVRPTSTILKYGDSAQDWVSIGRALGVDALLTGNFQKSGDKIRVTVQLVRTSDGTSLWAYKRDYQNSDIFEVQDAISEQTARALHLKLTSEETTLLSKHYTENSEAYEAYIKGRYVWGKHTTAGTERAIEYYQKATERDPDYALAYSGLADAYVVMSEFESVDLSQMSSKAHEAAVTALKKDDTLAEAHTSMGWVLLIFDWDLGKAEQEFKRAIDLNPNYPIAHQFYGVLLTATARFDEALAHRRAAQALDPVSASLKADGGRGAYFARSYDQAIDDCRRALEIEPNFAAAHLWIGESLEQEGLLEKATAEIKQALALFPSRGEMIGALGHVAAVSGRTLEAEQALSELGAGSAQHQFSAYFIAAIYTGLGQHERAFDYLEAAYRERSPYLLLRARVDPRLDPLRKDPRFEDLLRRPGLVQR